MILGIIRPNGHLLDTVLIVTLYSDGTRSGNLYYKGKYAWSYPRAKGICYSESIEDTHCIFIACN